MKKFSNGIKETYIVSNYNFKQTISECVNKLKQTVESNCHNLKASLDYCIIKEKINYEKEQVTFTLTWSNYYIPETITSFIVDLIR